MAKLSDNVFRSVWDDSSKKQLVVQPTEGYNQMRGLPANELQPASRLSRTTKGRPVQGPLAQKLGTDKPTLKVNSPKNTVRNKSYISKIEMPKFRKIEPLKHK